MLGNERLDVLPVWEMSFAHMPDNRWKIATERVKWSTKYQKRHGIMTDRAQARSGHGGTHPAHREAHLPRARSERLRARGLLLDNAGRVFVLEANPNPNLAYGEDSSRSRPNWAACPDEQLLARIIGLGLRWKPERTG